MVTIETGIMDRTRLVSNLLMLVLLVGNIFFSIQYSEGIKQQAIEEASSSQESVTRLQTSRFLKYFIDTVLNTKDAITFEDRVKLENDIRQLHDSTLTAGWDAFVASKDSTEAQENAVRLMSMLTSKLI